MGQFEIKFDNNTLLAEWKLIMFTKPGNTTLAAEIGNGTRFWMKKFVQFWIHSLKKTKTGAISSNYIPISSPKCGTLTWWGGLSGLIKY